jgi:hypothetical protein
MHVTSCNSPTFINLLRINLTALFLFVSLSLSLSLSLSPSLPPGSILLRYGTVQRPVSAYAGDGDRYSTSSSNRPGSFQSVNYAYGHGSGGTYDRPRPGPANFGASNSGDGEGDYLYTEGGSASGSSGGGTNLQTQKVRNPRL